MTRLDPGNAVWQSDLSVAHERIGDVLFDQKDVSAALESYRNALAIGERVAKADAKNNRWQRNLAISYTKVGDALLKQANFRTRLKAIGGDDDPRSSGKVRSFQHAMAAGPCQRGRKEGVALAAQDNLPAAL